MVTHMYKQTDRQGSSYTSFCELGSLDLPQLFVEQYYISLISGLYPVFFPSVCIDNNNYMKREEHIIVNTMYYWSMQQKWGRPGSEAYSTHSELINPIFNKCYSLEGTFGPFVQGRREMIH